MKSESANCGAEGSADEWNAKRSLFTCGFPAGQFDAHVHIHDERLNRRIDEVIAAALRAGLRGCRTCGTSPADWSAVAAIANFSTRAKASPADGGAERDGFVQSYAFAIAPAFGVHPWFTESLPQDWADELEKFLIEYPDAMVGEVGLDGLRADPDSAQCREVLTAQLEIAARLGRPVIMHGARAWDELYSAFRPYAAKVPAFMLHSFSGSPEQLRKWIDLGALFSVGGGICNPQSTRLRKTVMLIPEERLLFETDSPDMFPKGGISAEEGKRINQPVNLALVIKCYRQARETGEARN